MKFGMVIVLYHPSKEIVANIKKYIFWEVDVVIIDNTPIVSENYGEDFSRYGFSYLVNNNHGGIARAFNLGLDLLLEKGCDFLFTFDQDSVIPDHFFVSMKSFIVRYDADFVCPDFLDINSNTKATFIQLTKWCYKKVNRLGIPKPCDVSFAISSGMGFSKNMWVNLRYFNEDMIIDHGDTDFCLKAMSKGYKIKVNFDICLDHAIGERKLKKFLGVTFKPNNHNYIRKYYIVRNGTYASFKYFTRYPSYFYLNLLRVIHESVCVIFYEKDKIRKIRVIVKAIFDAMRGKLGPFKPY